MAHPERDPLGSGHDLGSDLSLDDRGVVTVVSDAHADGGGGVPCEIADDRAHADHAGPAFAQVEGVAETARSLQLGVKMLEVADRPLRIRTPALLLDDRVDLLIGYCRKEDLAK